MLIKTFASAPEPAFESEAQQCVVWGAVNCLAVRPGRVLMSDKVSERTQEKLDRAGISVRLVPYDKSCLGGGGIHCSTGPLIRDAL